MKDVPLLFTDEMVRAILDRRKTQTRRLKFRGAVGDRIWVKEAWTCFQHGRCKPTEIPDGAYISYRANGYSDLFKTRPAMFMPRRFSRINLSVEDVRHEHIQDISDEDIIAEGIQPPVNLSDEGVHDFLRLAFQNLWDEINKKRGHGWDTNPEVDAVTFRIE